MMTKYVEADSRNALKELLGMVVGQTKLMVIDHREWQVRKLHVEAMPFIGKAEYDLIEISKGDFDIDDPILLECSATGGIKRQDWENLLMEIYRVSPWDLVSFAIAN